MPNIMISGLPDATLPLDGPNSYFEVQTFEAGVAVSRRIASDDLQIQGSIIIEDEGVPLATGADTLNFVGANVVASGTGTTKTITIASGGQVDSVVSGVNITIDAGDPVNPIVNLDAAITGVSVNGVTLSNAGAATNFLDETGAYSVPPDTSTLGALTDVDLTGAADNDMLFRAGGLWIDTAGIVTFDGVGFLGVAVNTDGVSGFEVDTFTANSRSFIAVYNDDTAQYLEMSAIGSTIGDNLRFQFSTTTSQLDFLGDNGVHIELRDVTFVPHVDIPAGAVFTLGEKAAAAADVAGWGQLWAGTDQSLNFTDGLGATTILTAGGGFDPADDQVISGSWEFTNALGLELGPSCELRLRNNADSSTTFIQNLGPTLQFGIAGGDFGSGVVELGSSWSHLKMNRSIVFDEQASRPVVTAAGDGQIWVRNDAPNVLMFTDDDDTDFVLNAGLSPWTSDIDGAGFNLDGAGVIFLVAQTAADPDVGSQGQIWVEGVPGDPLWAEVVLLADFEGPDAATSYTEISVNAASATFVGNAELDTAEFESGTSSLLLDGTGDDLTFPDIAAYDLDTNDWTIEGFVRLNTLPPLQTSLGPGYMCFDMVNSGSALVNYALIQDGFGFRVRLSGSGFAEVGTIGGGLSTGTWYHWAMTRTGGQIRAYFNGNYEVGDFGGAPANMGGPDQPIGYGSRDNIDAFLDGWLDDCRITIGTARYTGTGTYTIPTTPYLTAPSDTNLYFTDDAGADFQLNAAGADTSISEINNQNNDYTLVLADKGKTIRRTTNGFAETWTIPAEASVDYDIGTWIAFYNDGGNTTSIAITTDLMRGTDGFTGTRTLGDNQRALIQKVASALWVYQATDL